ncbi:MAG TPA: TetR/AcrR family transcriptional regulator [Thermomicrobiales bacterium]|nr:TetR/AcrR family transcriptional regulator [Thermomicrobiales bacterium]
MTSPLDTPTEPRRPGRPRSVRAERAIHDATLELLVEQGYEGMTIEAVAARAGVGKATIYRRYDGKDVLVAAALRTLNPDPTFTLPDTGSVRGDFRLLIERFAATTFGTILGPMIVRVLSAAITNPAIQPIFVESVIAPRQAAALAIIRRGVERGELRAGLDIQRTLDMLIGAILFRVLFGGDDTSAIPDTIAGYVDLLIEGAAPDA